MEQYESRGVGRSAVLCLALAAAVFAVSARVAGAQNISFGGQTQIVPTNTDRGIPLGPWVFSPGVQVAWLETDNLFRTPEPTSSDSMLQVAARAQFDLALSEQSGLHFTYNPQYRTLEKYQLEENWSHLMRFRGDLVLPSGLKLLGTYDYNRSSLDVRDLDPSGELAFSARPYTRQRAGLRTDYWLSQIDAVSFDVDWNDLDYSGDDYFGSQQRQVGVGWVRSLSPLLNADIRYRRSSNNQNAFGGSPGTESTSDQISLQLDGDLTPFLTSDFRIGWRKSAYRPNGEGQSESSYQGIVLAGGVSWVVSESVRVHLRLSRSDYLTAVEGSKFSVTTRISAGVTAQRGRIGGALSGSFGRQDFNGADPVTGVKRSDDLLQATASVSFRLMTLLSARASYHYAGRDSDPAFTYDSSTVSVGIVAGF